MPSSPSCTELDRAIESLQKRQPGSHAEVLVVARQVAKEAASDKKYDEGISMINRGLEAWEAGFLEKKGSRSKLHLVRNPEILLSEWASKDGEVEPDSLKELANMYALRGQLHSSLDNHKAGHRDQEASEQLEQPSLMTASRSKTANLDEPLDAKASSRSRPDSPSHSDPRKSKKRDKKDDPVCLCGHLYKKSPHAIKWDLRFFIIADCKISWYAAQDMKTLKGKSASEIVAMFQAAEKLDQKCQKGSIDLTVTHASVSEHSSKAKRFSLGPKDGTWQPGATTDKHQDDKRVYTFELAKDCKHDRKAWVSAIRSQISAAKASREFSKPGSVSMCHMESEMWQDPTIDPEQELAAKNLEKKLNKRRQVEQQQQMGRN